MNHHLVVKLYLFTLLVRTNTSAWTIITYTTISIMTGKPKGLENTVWSYCMHKCKTKCILRHLNKKVIFFLLVCIYYVFIMYYYSQKQIKCHSNEKQDICIMHNIIPLWQFSSCYDYLYIFLLYILIYTDHAADSNKMHLIYINCLLFNHWYSLINKCLSIILTHQR